MTIKVSVIVEMNFMNRFNLILKGQQRSDRPWFLSSGRTCEVFKTLGNSDSGCLAFALVLIYVEVMCWYYKKIPNSSGLWAVLLAD